MSALQPSPRFVHVSLDSFFASVEQQRNPKLQGKPVVVGRTTVLSASPEAILAGVQPNMSLEAARQGCPALIALAGDFPLYAEYAERLRHLLGRYSSKIESGANCDYYLDFAGRHQPLQEFRGSLLRLQLEILQDLGLSTSIGAGSTRAIAAVASRLEGPRGLKLVAQGTERQFLQELPANLLPGVGPARALELAGYEVTTIGATGRIPRAALENAFGKHTGSELWHRARGLDATQAKRLQESEVVSRRFVIEGGTQDAEELCGAITYLCERIALDLNGNGRDAHNVSLAIRYKDDFSAQRSVRIEMPGSGILQLTLDLFRKLFTRPLGVEQIEIRVIPTTAHKPDLAACPAAAELPLAVNQ